MDRSFLHNSSNLGSVYHKSLKAVLRLVSHTMCDRGDDPVYKLQTDWFDLDLNVNFPSKPNANHLL